MNNFGIEILIVTEKKSAPKIYLYEFYISLLTGSSSSD